MRFCVGDEPECNGPECGHAETCPYFLEMSEDDSSLKDELEKWKKRKEEKNDTRWNQELR